MTKRKGVFRRSIWQDDQRYARAEGASLPENAEVIARLRWVEAAKKQVPPIPDQGFVEIANLANKVPAAEYATSEAIARYLKDATAIFGAGPAVCICMLAVLREGEFPPIDRKIIGGLRTMKQITKEQECCLESADTDSFARTYVEAVVPAWNRARDGHRRTPEQADEYIARGGSDG